MVRRFSVRSKRIQSPGLRKVSVGVKVSPSIASIVRDSIREAAFQTIRQVSDEFVEDVQDTVESGIIAKKNSLTKLGPLVPSLPDSVKVVEDNEKVDRISLKVSVGDKRLALIDRKVEYGTSETPPVPHWRPALARLNVRLKTGEIPAMISKKAISLIKERINA